MLDVWEDYWVRVGACTKCSDALVYLSLFIGCCHCNILLLSSTHAFILRLKWVFATHRKLIID